MTDKLVGKARRRISEDLVGCGVIRGGTLLVHSSLSALRHGSGADVPGGAETVIRGLLEVLGAEGTLLMPALSYATVNLDAPVFDARTTPGNVGIIPETFRLCEGTLRSTHPSHSVCAIGPRAEELLSDHEMDETPCGTHSPFQRLRQGGQLLFLGCGIRPNTSMHAVEEVAEAPYLFGDRVTWRGTTMDGREVGGRYQQHGFDGWRQRYDRMEALLPSDALRRGTVLGSDAVLIQIPEMWTAGLVAIKRDPYHFVQRYD
jgi:aminoglycoside 3-N-acetyltransferase